jgi:hypothetical protein
MEQKTGILSEHEPAQELTSGDQGGYNPSDEERKDIKLVQRLFEKAKKHRKEYDSKWLDYYKFIRGKQWKEQRPNYRHSEVVNMVHGALQSQTAILTDSRPRIEFAPTEPSDTEFTEFLNKALESDWERGNWLTELTEALWDSTYAIGHLGVEYDPEADLGAGAITLESKDPFHVFPDPSATDANKKGKFFVEAEPVDVEEAKADYPEKAKFIKADLIDLMGGSKTELDQIRYRSPVDARVMVDGNETSDQETNGQCLKITCYIKSNESVEEKKDETNPETGEVESVYESKLKYPNGRKIVVVGGVLCHSGPNPYDDGKFPYARLISNMLPREYFGIPDVELLESPQKVFNKLVSFALDVLTLMGNPIWIVDNDSEIDTDNLFNRPGLVVEKAKGSEVRREEGVQLQPYVLQMIDRMKTWFDDVSGNQDVSRGATPGDVTAASAIQSIQDAAQTRYRLKSRFLDATLKDVGSLWISRAMQFNSAPKMYRITQDENVQKYFKMYIEPVTHPETGEVVGKVAKVRGYNQDPSTGAYTEDAQAKEYQIRGDFDVRVNTGSSLPFAKANKTQQSLALFDRGLIDGEEVLKNLDYPNYQAVYQKAQAAKMAEQQAALDAQAQAAGGPQQPSPPAA